MNIHELMLNELRNNDGLAILGNGMGILYIIKLLIKKYAVEKYLVLILNLSKSDEEYIRMNIMNDNNSNLIKFINNDTDANKREEIYLNGGFISITNRILVVDMLRNVIPIGGITGIIINNAHRVTETSLESFVLYIYRKYNKNGFIKALSDYPNGFSSNLFRLPQLMRSMYVKKLYLWPRFHLDISNIMSEYPLNVIELYQPLTPTMLAIQDAIIEVMDGCVLELQASNKIELDNLNLSIEDGLTKDFERIIRNELEPIWHKINSKSKRLISDLGNLRRLLKYLLFYDAVAFYSYLNQIRIESQNNTFSLWIGTEAADRLFRLAKDRIYLFHPSELLIAHASDDMNKKNTFKLTVPLQTLIDDSSIELTLESNPKWTLLKDVLKEINELELKNNNNNNNNNNVNNNNNNNDKNVNNNNNNNVNNNNNNNNVNNNNNNNEMTRVLILCGNGQESSRTCRQVAKCLSMNNNDETMKNLWQQYVLQQNWDSSRLSFDENAEYTLNQWKQILLIHCLENIRNQILSEEIKKQCNDNTTLIIDDNNKNKLIIDKTKKIKVNNKKICSIDNIISSVHTTIKDNTNNLEILIYPTENTMNILESFQPQYVICYDPRVKLTRELEMYHAYNNTLPLTIYFVLYDESLEKQQYLTSLKNEQASFEKLIDRKRHLVLTEDTDRKLDTENINTEDDINSLFQPTTTLSSSSSSSSLQNIIAQNKLNQQTRRGGGRHQFKRQRKIIVDIREFRSSLPFALYQKEFLIVPLHLTIGDYILSPSICIERKSLIDLLGSLNSGRLFKQLTEMCRHFKYPVLLIEFEERKPFRLQTKNDDEYTDTYISKRDINAKLVLITIHFPSVRIIWTHGPHNTASIFEVLKSFDDEPNEEDAVAAGTNEAAFAHLPSDILSLLPGIQSSNKSKILQTIPSLADLMKLSEEEILELVGTINGKQLNTFLSKDFSQTGVSNK